MGPKAAGNAKTRDLKTLGGGFFGGNVFEGKCAVSHTVPLEMLEEEGKKEEGRGGRE